VSLTTIDSTRFGVVDVAEEAVIEFPHGLIGLTGTRYTLMARDEDATFLWLHSIDDPSLAIPVVNPWKFFDDYDVIVGDSEAARIGITDADNAEVYVTVRAAEDMADFTANLRAPILVIAGRGYQVVNESDDAPLRAPLFASALRGEPSGQAA
jgi:flagellar assembly factor FliW